MSFPNVPKDIKNYLSTAYMNASQWKLPNGETSDTSQSIEVKRVGVIGGGTMGRGIAIAICLAGYKTILVENDQKSLDYCRSELKVTIEREIELKRFKEQQANLLQSEQFITTTDLNKLQEVDLVIEAVFENMQLKKELFTKLDKICNSKCIFGTNTSSLNIDEMSSVLSNPTRLVGIHFFNPAHVLRIVEVVRGKYTSGVSVATAFEVCQKMKKVAVLVGNCPSFVFNRLLAVYVNQSHKLMCNYSLFPQDIDRIVLSRGFLMGPITMLDMNGLDVMAKVKEENGVELNELERQLLSKKRLGRKTGKGFYSYDDVDRKKSNDIEVEDIIRRISHNKNINIHLLSDSEVMEFLLFPMVNEGFLCIQEGIIESEDLIDIMFIFGFGWPAATGGPMHWGRHIGLHKIAETIRIWQKLEPNDRTFLLSKALVKAAKDSAKL